MHKRQKFIIKFFTEIMVKGKRAKREMIGQLYNNIKSLLLKKSDEIEIKKYSDKFEVEVPLSLNSKIRDILLNTPGIDLVLEALQFENIKTIDDIKVITQETLGSIIEDKSFVVRVKRKGVHNFASIDIEQSVGGYMLAKSKNSRVDLHNPDVTIRLELDQNKLNVITKKHQGLGGYPLGSQGEILSLMSGGFDSTVASYMSIKRGIKTHFIFFNLGGIAHEIGVKQVALYLWEKYASTHKVSFISVPFDDVVSEIFRSVSKSYMGVMLKRLMLQAAQKVADSMNIDALLTGESIAQVSSQTLRNLSLIDSATEKLVIRPLSTMNKSDIIDIAYKIGTKEFAENMPEYCGVISQNPVTHGSFKRVKEESSKFDYSVLDSAVENVSIIEVKDIVDDIAGIAQVEVVRDISDGNYTIIDIRDDVKKSDIDPNSIKIPFYKLKTEFKKLPQDRKYLLYCDKGIMSQLHAQYLRDRYKCNNVRVYRP